MFDQFTKLVSEASYWTYGVLLAFALLDAILPIVPSEASVITAGVVSASGNLSLPLIIAAAAVGAFFGDNLGYLLGRKFGPWVKDRFFGAASSAQRLDWAERQLRERGGELIVIGRFIPGGRTAVALSAGTLGFPWRRFAGFDVIAALVWASYAGLLGFIGGHAFEDAPWKGLVLAFGIALAVAGGVEVTRWILKRRSGAKNQP